MSQQAPYLWKPIEDLPADAASLANPETSALIAAWHEYVQTLKNREAYDRFLTQLRRQWAIETGIIERLYSLSEGATKTLIEKGLDEALISHGDTDRAPAQVIAMINDQYHAIEGLYQFISGDRPLGTSYIKELHRVLTNNQLRYDAIDTLGNRVERDLPRGQWKKLPNNVEGPDDFVFQFCPPEHVDAEMDRLLQLHEQHERAGIPPDVEAAWLHHRFTLIHPFTDGNGRVARCLATLVLLKANWFPLVVTRDDRAEYIAALRAADKGHLANLVRLFDTLQNRTIHKALTIHMGQETPAFAVKDILDAVKSKLQQSNDQPQKYMHIFDAGEELLELSHKRLKDIGQEIESGMQGVTPKIHITADAVRFPDAKLHPETRPLLNLVENYHPDVNAYSGWSRLVITTNFQFEMSFLFHGIGRDTGVLGCSPVAYKRHKFGTQEIVLDNIQLAQDPFYITSFESSQALSERFQKWLEQMILAGLDYWRKSIGA